MKKLLSLCFLSATLLFFGSCQRINGEGPLVTETITISGFTGIDMAVPGTLHFIPDSVYSVQIQAQQNILDAIETPMVNQSLEIRLKRYVHLHSFEPITVTIHAPNISALAISGSANIYVDKPFQGNSLQLSIAGSGNIHTGSILMQKNIGISVSGSGSVFMTQLQCNSLQSSISGSADIAAANGSVENENIQISGSGNVDYSQIMGQNITIQSSGSGTVKVNAGQTLNVHISGSGNIYYSGNPTISVSISGSGKLIPQ